LLRAPERIMIFICDRSTHAHAWVDLTLKASKRIAEGKRVALVTKAR
jgi:hypothetical protein